jgi:hypothetical protein
MANKEASSMHCPFCHQQIESDKAWKGTAGRFYCSEFCADSETVIPIHHAEVRKDQIDRQYLERLERLLPLRRSFQDR